MWTLVVVFLFINSAGKEDSKAFKVTEYSSVSKCRAGGAKLINEISLDEKWLNQNRVTGVAWNCVQQPTI